MNDYNAIRLTERWLNGKAQLDCDDGMKKIWRDMMLYSRATEDMQKNLAYEGIRAGRVWEKISEAAN